MLRLNVETSFRAAGYAAILLIGVLSLIPGTLRPETGAPGQFEHFVAYLGAAPSWLWALIRRASAGRVCGSSLTRPLWKPLNFSFQDAIRVSRTLRSARLGQLLGIILAFGIAPILYGFWRAGRIQ